MAANLKDLQAARERVGRDLDRFLDERSQLRHSKQKAQHRDPATDQREQTLAQRVEDLQAKERDLTKHIKSLREREEGIIAKLKRYRRDQKASKRIVVQGGDPHWGGGDDILRNETDPVAQKFGDDVTSRKRAANDPLTVSNPSSDHSALALWASAVDYGTFDGAGLAHAIAAALGISNYSTGNYNGYYIERAGHTYRVQILWAVEGHYNHVHVGIRLV